MRFIIQDIRSIIGKPTYISTTSERKSMVNDRINGDILERLDLALISGLLFLAIPFRLGIGFIFPSFPTWATNILQLGTYLILCILTLLKVYSQ